MEIFDLYDAGRRATGETMERYTPTPAGRFRLVVHILIFNSKGQLLIQQRKRTKSHWGGMWDVSVGGAVTAGEDSQLGAHRELLEELGLDVDFSGIAPAVTTTFTGGFDDMYVLNMEPDLASLKLQETEVEAVRWADQAEVLALIDSGDFIPYQKDLMAYLFFRRDHKGNFDIDRA